MGLAQIRHLTQGFRLRLIFLVSASIFMYSRSRYNHSRPMRPARFLARPRSSFNPYTMAMRQKTVVQEAPYVTVHKFADFAVAEAVKKNVIAKGYDTPTPIQDQVIPAVLAGRDVIGIANTGTGKTAAFLIPLIEKVLKNRNEKVLIVAPTRELAVQIQDELVSFSYGLDIHSVLCIGGMNMFGQQSNLRRPHNFIIGTPGRLREFVDERRISLDSIRSVVLDEADHMVDIGFIVDIKFIISYLPKTRQSLFFSATIDNKVREILRMFVTDPVTISVKTQEAAVNVEQKMINLKPGMTKLDQLHDMLIQKDFEKVLIFGRTKHGVQRLADDLIKRGFKAGAIHGNKSQSQRQHTLDNFKGNRLQILLATDVASRGLDIPDVTHVINYELPESQDAYVHRIGRTGRADKKGTAITFLQ